MCTNEKKCLFAKLEEFLSKYERVSGFERIDTFRLQAEIDNFIEMLIEEPVENSHDAYKNTKILPNLSALYGVLLTLPVTSNEAERSFSTFRRLKTYLRAKMTGQRCSNLARLTIHREQTEAMDRRDIIIAFSAKRVRRLSYLSLFF